MSESESSIELGLAGTGASLTKSGGLALGGGTLISLFIGIGLYPETITIAGKVLNARDPMLMAYVGAGAAWCINFVRKFIMKHS